MADPLNPPNDDPTSTGGVSRWGKWVVLGLTPLVVAIMAAIVIGRFAFGGLTVLFSGLRNVAAEAQGAAVSVTDDKFLGVTVMVAHGLYLMSLAGSPGVLV